MWGATHGGPSSHGLPADLAQLGMEEAHRLGKLAGGFVIMGLEYCGNGTRCTGTETGMGKKTWLRGERYGYGYGGRGGSAQVKGGMM